MIKIRDCLVLKLKYIFIIFSQVVIWDKWQAKSGGRPNNQKPWVFKLLLTIYTEVIVFYCHWIDIRSLYKYTSSQSLLNIHLPYHGQWLLNLYFIWAVVLFPTIYKNSSLECFVITLKFNTWTWNYLQYLFEICLILSDYVMSLINIS